MSFRRWASTVQAVLDRLATPKARFAVAGALAALWLLSLALPALRTVFVPLNEPITLFGGQILLSGFVALAHFQPGWFANIFLIGVLLGATSTSIGRRFHTVNAVLLVLCSLATFDLALQPQFYGHVVFLPGYFTWIAANLLAATYGLAVGSASQWRHSNAGRDLQVPSSPRA